jgi:malate synthase
MPPTTALRIAARDVDDSSRVLTPDALTFIEDLVRTFRPRVDELRARRVARRAELAAGAKLGFLPDTKDVRR